MINWNLFMFLIYVTPYSGSCICDDIEVSQEVGALFSSSVSFPCISPLTLPPEQIQLQVYVTYRVSIVPSKVHKN